MERLVHVGAGDVFAGISRALHHRFTVGGQSPPNMPPPPSAAGTMNGRVSAFYDRAARLYPLVDCFCAPTRRRLIQQINREPAGTLLDVGVGPGRHLRLYRRHQISAIDCSAEMVVRCRRHSPDTAVWQMDGERLEFPTASFRYVTLFHVLAVTTDPAKMLAEAHRVLCPGGRLFVLNHETPSNIWRHIDTMLAPLARGLHFRSRFRLADIPGVERFQTRVLESTGLFGLMNAYSLEK